METILKIRRLHFKEGLSQRTIAKKFNLSRPTIKKYLALDEVEPPIYKRTIKTYRKLGAFIPHLEQRLIEEQKGAKTEHLTARRHFEWLRSEGYQGQYCAVASFIRDFKKHYSPPHPEVFIPLTFPIGETYQFDWSNEVVRLNGVITKVSIAHFCLCYSRAFFIRAYHNQKLEMLIDAHNHAFNYYEGTPKRGVYDNMKTAVKWIGKGKERIFNERFLAMMNHFLIEPVACTPESGWEKGQVERQIKTLRQQLFKPILSFSSLEELNAYLLTQCHQKIATKQHVDDRTRTVAEYLREERQQLSSYQPFLGYHYELLRVNSLSLCRYDGHKYSVPCHLVGKVVTLQVTATQIKMIFENNCVAIHPRSYEKGKTSYSPLHYLSALKRKPGALRHGEPFVHWQLPTAIKTIQGHLLKQPKGDRAMVQLLTLIADYGEEVGIAAAEIALEEGVPSVEAVLNIIHRLLEPVPPVLKVKEIPLLVPPEGNCKRYNFLLKREPYAAS